MKNVDLGMKVSDDVIVEILSRLPVKYVLRCKCVCKSWLIITQQKFFIEKHLSRSRIVYKYKDIYKHMKDRWYEIYYHVDSLNGLVLETENNTDLHRIRNPATKQVLQVTSTVFKSSFKYIIGFDPSTSMYKLVNYYFKQGTSGNIGVRMLTIGSDDDHAWRYLDDINLLFDNSRRYIHIYHKDVSYTATYSCEELEKTDILRLPMDGNSSMKIKVPQSFQTLRVKYHYALQMFILGEEKLSIGFIIKRKLHVWILENYEKHIWSEKKIIPLDFIKKLPVWGNTINVQASPNLDKLRVSVDNYYVEYDVHSNSFICLAEFPPHSLFLYNISPSLVSLKGMRPEDP